METQCQHLTMTQRNELIKVVEKLNYLFMEHLEPGKKDPVDFKLKEDKNPIR